MTTNDRFRKSATVTIMGNPKCRVTSLKLLHWLDATPTDYGIRLPVCLATSNRPIKKSMKHLTFGVRTFDFG